MRETGIDKALAAFRVTRRQNVGSQRPFVGTLGGAVELESWIFQQGWAAALAAVRNHGSALQAAALHQRSEQVGQSAATVLAVLDMVRDGVEPSWDEPTPAPVGRGVGVEA